MHFQLNIDKAKARDTGMALTLLLLLLELWLGGGWFLKAAIAALLIAMTVPILLRPAAFVWFGFAHIIGTIASKVILSLIYVVLVLPVGLLRRISGKDTLKLKDWKKSASSVFVSREHIFTGDDLDKPY